jgi:hypothetical protein
MVDFTIAGPNNDLNVEMVHSTLTDTYNLTILDSMEQRLQQGVKLRASCIWAALRAWSCVCLLPDNEEGPCNIIPHEDEWWRRNITLEVVSTYANFLMFRLIFNLSY